MLGDQQTQAPPCGRTTDGSEETQLRYGEIEAVGADHGGDANHRAGGDEGALARSHERVRLGERRFVAGRSTGRQKPAMAE